MLYAQRMDDFSRRFASLKPFLIFECAARHESFSGAARAFNISQPSVSRNVAQLEREIGVLLFDRRATGARLTDDGRELFHAITRGLGTIAETVTRLERRRQEAEGVVRLSVSGSFVAHWMAPRLAAFTRAFPDVRLRFHLLSGLMVDPPEDVDLAVRIVDDPKEAGKNRAFAPEIVIPVCSPGYLDTSRTGEGRTFLHFADHPRTIWRDRTALGQPGDRPGDLCHEFDDYSVLLQAALDGSGVALGWLSVTSKLLLDGRLVPVDGTAFHTGRTHRLIEVGHGAPRPRVSQIAEWLVARMAEDIAALDPVLQRRRAPPDAPPSLP